MRLGGWQDAGERFQVVEEKQKWNAGAFHWQDIRFVHSRRRYCRKTVPTIIMGEMKKVSRKMRSERAAPRKGGEDGAEGGCLVWGKSDLHLIGFDIDFLHGVLQVVGKEDGSICLEAGGVIADIVFDRADTCTLFEGEHFCSFCTCADEGGVGEGFGDCPGEEGVVGTAEDEGIDAGFTDGSEVALTGEAGDGIAFG